MSGQTENVTALKAAVVERELVIDTGDERIYRVWVKDEVSGAVLGYGEDCLSDALEECPAGYWVYDPDHDKTYATLGGAFKTLELGLLAVLAALVWVASLEQVRVRLERRCSPAVVPPEPPDDEPTFAEQAEDLLIECGYSHEWFDDVRRSEA